MTAAMTYSRILLVLITVLASIFSCQGKHIPRPPTDLQISDITSTSVRLSWAHNPISEEVLHYVIRYRPKSSNKGYSEFSTVTTNTYTIRDLNPLTEYEFSVYAVNSAGRGAPSAPVVSPFLVPDPGSPPTNIQARPLSSTSVVIQWDPPKEFIGRVLAYKVFYTTRLDLTVSKWNMQQVGNNHLTTLNDLTPHTVYAIVIQAFSIHGPGPHSAPIQVKTQRGVPSQPGRIVVTDISLSSVTLYWQKPSIESEKIIGYELYWNDTYTNEQHQKKLNYTDSHEIRGLHPDTLYSVWVAAKTVEAEGAPTPPIQVRTSHYIPGKPRKLTAKTINTTAVTISWKHPINKDRGGLIEGYQIYLDETSRSSGNLPNNSKHYYVASESAVEYNITDLQPSTQYNVQMAAVTRMGAGNRTKIKAARTSGGVPTKPELRVRLIHDDPHFIIEITWYPPIYIYGNLIAYRLIYGRSDLLGKKEMKLQELDPRAEKQTIHYLDYGAPYEFYLSAKNDFGWGQEAVQYLRTPEEVPHAAPQNLTHHLQSSNSVVVSWQPPPLQYRNGDIIEYGILSHKLLDESNGERRTFHTRMVFSGLEKGTDYIFRVRAYTAKGAGPWSSRLGMSTPQYVLPAPTDIVALAASEQSVEVSWDWDPAPYLVDVLGFQVIYTKDPVEDLDQWNRKEVPFTFSAELTGLEKYDVYTIRVAVVTGDGLGELSNMERVLVDPTDVPTELRAKDITTDSMTLSWSKPIKLDPFKYQISYDAYKEYYDSDGNLQKFHIPTHTAYVESHIEEYPLYDLLSFTSYRINVTVIALDEQLRPPAKITVTTAMTAPKPMVKPNIVGLGGEVSVILPKVSEEHGPISHYYLVVVPAQYANRDPGEYLTGELGAVPSDKIGPYIAARFLYGSMPQRLPLGDGEVYGAFENRKLQHNEKYRVFVRAVVDSPSKSLYSSSSLSDLISWDVTSPAEPIMHIDYGFDIPGYDIPECISMGSKTVDFAWIVFTAVVIILFAS